MAASLRSRLNEKEWMNFHDEDWESQSSSGLARSPPTQATRNAGKTGSTTSSSGGSMGRLASVVRPGQDLSSNSSNVLSERSANEINLFGTTRRGPSKLSSEFRLSGVQELQSRGRQTSRRSVSVSSLGTVVHNTTERKPHSVSPGKGAGDRMPALSDFSPGELRDLFTPAHVGLESIFNPPPECSYSAIPGAAQEEDEDNEADEPQDDGKTCAGQCFAENEWPQEGPEAANDVTMPSSPPVRAAQFDSSTDFHDESLAPRLPDLHRMHALEPLEEEPETFAETFAEESQHSSESQNEDESVSNEGSLIRHPMGRESRLVSGQSVLRNESFSAIMISPEKEKGGDGAVFYPVELVPGELKRRLENLRWNQMVLADDAVQEGAAEQSINIGVKSFQAHGNTSEYEKMGGFINCRRGGRSADGSFRDRMLSPPIGNDTSDMLPEESLQASTPKQFASVRIDAETNNGTVNERRSLLLPRVPNPSPEKGGTLPRQQPATGGSPLKLFEAYDTFTGQMLLRRISQFEEQMSNGSQVSADRSGHSNADEASKSELERAFVASPQKTATTTTPNQAGSRQSSAQFGAGELDGYPFVDERPAPALAQQRAAREDANQSSMLFPSAPLERRHGGLHIQRMRQSRDGLSSRPSTAGNGTEPLDAATSGGHMLHPATPRRAADVGSEGKRPRTSPSKDPTPKRRRTLHKSDVAFGVEVAQASPTPSNAGGPQQPHRLTQPVIGRKRRDARDGDEVQHAGPDVLASREILRPRTPTPSQRSSVLREQHDAHAAAGGSPYDQEDGDEDSHDDRGGRGDGNGDGHHVQQMDSYGRDSSGRGSSAVWSDSSLAGPPVPASGAPHTNGVRKQSLGTEDYMGEAVKVMEHLRKGVLVGQRGGLASLEESEMESAGYGAGEPAGGDEADSSFEESTREPFSRPPSREGKPVARVARVQENPEVVARLKKYEERSDLDDLVSTTTRSIHLAQSAIRAEKEAAQAVQNTIDTMVGTFRRTRLDESDDISDPPNIRISANPQRAQQDEQDEQGPSGQQGQQGHALGMYDGHPSQASQRSVSSGVSTGRSIPTGSSRGSESRKTIALETVSHLIPDQVGSMQFDRDRAMWVKNRSGSGSRSRSGSGCVGGSGNGSGSGSGSGAVPAAAAAASTHALHTMLPSEGSEEDALDDITDLPVDAAKEQQFLKPAVASPVKPFGPTLLTKAGLASSSAGPVFNLGGSAAGDDSVAHAHEAADHDAGVEHEITIDEGRVSHASPPSKKRHLAISFSSPIASIIQDFVAEGGSDTRLEHEDEPTVAAAAAASAVGSQHPSGSSLRRGRRTVSVQFTSTAGDGHDGGSGIGIDDANVPRSRSTSRGPSSRTFSVAGQAFVPRPVSRIDEWEEEEEQERSKTGHGLRLGSVAGQQQRETSVSVLVTTPGPAMRLRVNSGHDDANETYNNNSSNDAYEDDDEQVMAQYVGMLSLSPMSEFTMHQERSLALEASYVAGDRRVVTGRSSSSRRRSRSSSSSSSGKTVLRQNVQALVTRLAEVEPFEPYWEDMEALDVQGKGLESLHQLEAFCPQLVTLEAGSNGLRHLGGVPGTVRHLRVADNLLSELTSWGRLANLQYLDISGNAVKTLSGLKGLVHLRSLRADGCGLTSLAALQGHDGLQRLRARSNAIGGVVDFAGTRLQRLEELDLEDNAVAAVAHVEALVSLATLNLRGNALTEVGGWRLTGLRTLNVSDNRLARLDVGALAGLRTLVADRNGLRRVEGLAGTPRLDSVSVREQALGPGAALEVSWLYAAYEVRKVYLSGNVLGGGSGGGCGFEPPVAFLNLQLLEMANCGLTRLAAGLGRRLAPNLRKVNVNFNALTDLGPLAGSARLKRVLAAGNRVAHALGAVRVLATLAHLAEVDLRDNPVTQGFYPNGRWAAAAAGTAAAREAAPGEPFALAAADAVQDAAYCRRLDLTTGMRRRVYSQVVGEACGKLQRLDGLAVDRGLGAVRDAVWAGLVARGVVVGERGVDEERGERVDEKEDEEVDEEVDEKEEAEKEEANRWEAEDSFA